MYGQIDNYKKLAEACDCYNDYEKGCCPHFGCGIRENCDKGFKVNQKTKSTVNQIER